MQPRDAELLLLFATLVRVVARSSGPGCEPAVVEVGKWVLRLLLGRLAHVQEVRRGRGTRTCGWAAHKSLRGRSDCRDACF
jgi:hypothetical protein